jgi:hypothetical protein
MSLSRLAVRIAAVQALRDMTLAEGRVYDSSTTPLDAAIRAQPLPFLMVTTDMHDREITGRDLSHGDDTLDLVIEVAIASRVTVKTGEGDEDQIVIPNTDAGMEITLDLIEAQIASALTWHKTEWAVVFAALVPRITKRQSRRGASAEDGNRFAARQIVISCDPLADPVTGQPIPSGGAWDQFLTAVEADENLAPLSPVLRLHIEGAEVPTWEAIGRALAISPETVGALGLAPSVLSSAGDAVPLDEVVAAQDGADDLSLTDQAAEDQGV